MPAECKVPEARLRTRLAQGWSYRAIASETGWSAGTIRIRCLALGLPLPERRSHGNRRMTDEAVRHGLIETSMTLREIADANGVSSPAVVKRAQKLGLPTDRDDRAMLRCRLGLPLLPYVRFGCRRIVADEAIEAELTTSVDSLQAIGRRLGCHQETVTHRARALGLPTEVLGHARLRDALVAEAA